MKNKEEKKEIIIKYKIDRRKKEINIFGDNFVNNNKNNYILIYEGNEYELSTKLNIENSINKRKKEINLFGETFINNNKNNYILIYDGNEYELVAKLNTKNVKSKIIEVKLKEIKNVTNMGNMFKGCSSLLSLFDISK